MKKVVAFTLMLLMVFTFAACSSDSNEVKDYIEKNKEELLESMENSFAEASGLTCSSSIKVKGAGFIITIKIKEFDDLDSGTKAAMQSVYDGMQSNFDALFEDFKEEIPSLEYFAIRVCEKDGDLIATVRAGK